MCVAFHEPAEFILNLSRLVLANSIVLSSAMVLTFDVCVALFLTGLLAGPLRPAIECFRTSFLERLIVC